ncbi:conserved hypothetical protein [Sporisorium reilianum SRZ2]|uniref:Uncharacterized protein n=1 Tax=Sporisorium reilianum (strain SRZ2) TaxID=999809 RepID=E6ZYT5_SPORE|nr:conserved hypothetical protein [Sporisorium reilianum SRZ2]
MRLKAQQKLQDQAATSSPASNPTSIVAIDVEEDEEDLGSLTLGRSKRQAALKRPATYSIDPLDDSSRLKRHPNKLPSLVAKYAAVPVSKAKGIDSLLRDQQRRSKHGTDADGFSRAEAIARSMEQERLGRMGIACCDDSDSDDRRAGPSRHSRSPKLDSSRASRAQASAFASARNINGKEPQLTVKALSPTIPSFLWSSQSEAADSDDDASDEADSRTAKHRLAASLAAVGADEDEKQLALDILQADMGEGKGDAMQKSKGHITFYRKGKVLAPTTTFFCPLPSVTKSTPQDTNPSPTAPAPATVAAAAAADAPPVSDELEWNTLARHILLAGFLPPSLDLDKRQIRRILVWLSISFVLEQDAMQSRLISTLFQSLVFDSAKSHYHRHLESAIPKALTDVVKRVPHILYRLGMDDDVFEQCFPDNSKVMDVPLFTVAQRKPTSSQSQAQQEGTSRSSPSAEFSEFKVYLTQAERDETLISLARMLDMIACVRDPTLVTDNLTVLAGYIASMAVACAATTSFSLANQAGAAFTSILRAAARAGGETLRTLQEHVCRRTLSALGTDAVAVRARLVAVFPGDGSEVGAVRRWLAWCALTEHVAPTQALAASPVGSDAVPSSDPFADEVEEVQPQPQEGNETAHWRRTAFDALTLDVDVLIAAVDAGDARSPFYIAPLVPNSGKDAAAGAEKHEQTHERARAHAPLERSTNFEALLAGTQLLAHTLRDLPVHMCTFHHPTSNRKPPRALRLALAPYSAHHAQLDAKRTAALHTLVQRLAHVNSRIRDNRANVILQTLAKDALHRTALAVEYQLGVYGAPGAVGGSFFQ